MHSSRLRMKNIHVNNYILNFHPIPKGQIQYRVDWDKKAHRNQFIKRGVTTIDIDILFYDDILFETKKLIIPHPRLHLRKFTLLPLVEIAPDFIHDQPTHHGTDQL